MTVAAATVLPLMASAMPPMPGIINTMQPDGTPIELCLHGDEHFAWATSPDGYTLLRDAAGYWTVAGADTSGYASVSAVRYTGNAAAVLAPDVKPGLMFAPEKLDAIRRVRRNAAQKVQIDNSFPTRGKRKLLMLLVNFSDTEPTYTQEDFTNFMNQESYGGIGSFRDFYLENSYGALDIETTVSRWITLPRGKAGYTLETVPDMIYYALSELAGELDLKQFDNDGDGILDGLALIHQGAGQEASGSAVDIWSHSSVVFGMNVGGVEVRRYTCEPELVGTDGRMSTVGVMCHEFGHNLGAPDFYDTDYAGSGGDFPGTGVWDLMGSGAWNGSQGDRPAGVNMWQKIQYGWVKPELLQETCEVGSMPGATFTPKAYRVNTTVPGEYFILENRIQEGEFDSALPGGGLLIYHANDPMIAEKVEPNTVNATFPQTMYTVCATAGMDPKNEPYTYGNLKEAPFPGKNGENEFSDTSLPSARSISGRYSYKTIRDISKNSDGTINFSFVKEPAPASPQNLGASTVRGEVFLKWDMPEDAGFSYFNVYRDGDKVAETSEPAFHESCDTGALLTYDVDAVYPDGLVSPYSSVTLRVPANKVEAIEAVEENGGVRLNWTLPNRITRIERGAPNDRFIVAEYDIKSADFVHRFTVDDLAVYKGCKIRKIGFCPSQGTQEVDFTVRVWEAGRDGSDPKIVSERAVKELGVGTWNSVLLTKPVEITADRELWVGVYMQSKKNNLMVLMEDAGVVPGMGNLMRLDTGVWEPDNSAPGNYYIYAEVTNAADDTSSPLGDFAAPADPAYDLFFPVGFSVYRDGILLGTTSSRCFVDAQASNGMHTYTVASYYKGNNESMGLDMEVNVSSAGVDAVSDTEVSIASVTGGLIVTGSNGSLSVADMQGRTVYSSLSYNGGIIKLSPGVYVVRTRQGVMKSLVK